MTKSKLRLAFVLFLCMFISLPNLLAVNSDQTEVDIDIPVTAESIFGSFTQGDFVEAYKNGEKTYIRIYQAVYDDTSVLPKIPWKDIVQDSEGNIEILSGKDGKKFFFGFGTPSRQKYFAENYRLQGIEKQKKELAKHKEISKLNNPLVRSFLVDSKVAVGIMENAVPETFSAKGLDDIAVDLSKSPNQFGLGEQSIELLRQNALSGSLVTYYLDEQSFISKKTSWGIVEPLSKLGEKYSPNHFMISDQGRRDLLTLKEMYDRHKTDPESNKFKKTEDFYKEYTKRGGTKGLEYFYEAIVPAWATQANKYDLNALLFTENTLQYFRQKVRDISQDTISEKGGIDELERKSSQHKQNLKRRNDLVILYKEVNRFLQLEHVIYPGRHSFQQLTDTSNDRWMHFKTGHEVTEKLTYFEGKLRNGLREIKEVDSNPEKVPSEKSLRVRSQVDKFIQTLDQESLHEEKIVIKVGKTNDFDHFHIVDLNQNFPSPRLVGKNLAIEFEDYTSKDEANSKLTAEGISKFIKRNFIGQSIDEIYVYSPSLDSKDKIYNFITTLSTHLKQQGEGYDERMIEANKCSSFHSEYGKIVFFPDIQYMWSKDTQGTVLIFDKGKGHLFGRTINHNSAVFEGHTEIKNNLFKRETEHYSGIHIAEGLFKDNELKKSENENKGKGKLKEGKDKALKDSSTDEINKMAGGAVCQTRRRTRAICEIKETDIDLVEDSVEIVGDKIKFQVYEKNNPTKVYDVENDLTPSIKSLTERQHNVMSKIHLGLGIHGAVLNFLGALHYFQVGDNARGGFSLYQSLHSFGQLSGLNEKITYRISESVAGRVLKNFLHKTSIKLASVLLNSDKLAEKAVSSFERLTQSVSVTSIVFSIYFIEEDIRNLVNNKDDDLIPLYAIDLALDTAITGLAVIPELEPVALALTLVRMVLDDVYMDILDEWKRAKGKGVLEHIRAVIVGIIEGLEDFISLGLTRQMREFGRQEETSREFLRNLSNIQNYFSVSKEEDGFSQLDLTTGEDFMYSGLVNVRLFDNNTFEIEIDAVPTISGRTTLKKLFNGNIKDIILGIGETLDLVNYGVASAKLWIFQVPSGYHTFEFKPSSSSSYGQYFGNRQNNTFAAIQGNHSRTLENQCQDTITQNGASLQLGKISYYVSGKDGDDIFLLGPESFYIDGGRGHDSYFVPWYGGQTVIDNFAEDAAVDSLYINVSNNLVNCLRQNDDLQVSYCGEKTVVVKNWFASTARSFNQHLRIITNDGVTLEPFETNLEQNRVHCYPKYIDLSHKTESNTIDLSKQNLQHVTQLIGSNFSDIITGNQIGNILNGGFGEDTLTGGEGDDIYVISSGEGCDVINITAKYSSTERILFDAMYNNIEIAKKSSQEVEVFDTSDRYKTCFTIVDNSQFMGEQKLLVVTADKFIFEIKHKEDNKEPYMLSVIVDFSLSDKGVYVDLLGDNSGVKDAARIITVIDSKNSDTIRANNQDNFLSCSGGEHDVLAGRGGHDTYVIQKECRQVDISNYDPYQKWDRLIVKSEYYSLQLRVSNSNSLLIETETEDIQIKLLNWFVSSKHQHLVVETEDGITCSLPTSIKDVSPSMNMLPYEIRLTKHSCKGGSHMSLDLSVGPWTHVTKIVARSTSCVYSVSGNTLGNYIDLGPTNVTERRYMEGRNGSDTYVVEYGYGTYNEIFNFASDEKMDHLLLGILYNELKISVVEKDMILTSSSHPESVGVRLLNFLSGNTCQHLIATTSDGITMKLESKFPYKTVVIIDKSYSLHSVVIDKNTYPDIKTARRITGSMLEKNYIEGGDETVYISGGEQNDTLHGGNSGETLDGLEGSDCIYGNDGNDLLIGGPGDDLLIGGQGDDTLFGGEGADTIKGGKGSNTVVFKGDGLNQEGVYVYLQTGRGVNADAEGDYYEDIQNIYGSEYNDILHGNNQDNIIDGFQGTDYIHPYGSNDILTGGPGEDLYNCSGATGRKQIWLDGEMKSPDVIIVDTNTMKELCYFLVGDNLVITHTDSKPETDRLELMIMNFTAEKPLKNFDLQIGSSLHESTFADAYSVNNDILLFKLLSWMHVLDVSENEIILLLNGTFLQHYIDGNVNLRLLLSYSSNNIFNVTDITKEQFNRSDLIIVSNLLPGIEYTMTLSLFKCNTELISNFVKQYTFPLPPSNLKASDILFDGFNVMWTLPRKLETNYSFDCYVNSVDGSFNFIFNTKKPMLVIRSLTPHTDYEVRVRSVVSTYTSVYSESLYVRTNATCDNINPPIGGYKKSTVQTGKGHHVTMACQDGYELIGDESVICDDGKTIGNQICSQKMCTIPESFKSNAVIKWYKDSPWSEWEVTMECSDGFEIIPFKTIQYTARCIKGLWVDELLPCKPVLRCPFPNAPENGKLDIPSSMSSGFGINVSIDVHCVRGFAIEGPTQIICLGSSWTELPKCKQLFCPPPPQVNHGHYQYLSGSDISKGAEQNAMAGLKCDLYHVPEKGDSVKIIEYIMSNEVVAEHIKCDDGKWIQKVQNCVPTAALMNKVEYLFSVRGYGKLMPKITRDQLDIKTTQTVLGNICKSMGLTYYGNICNSMGLTFTGHTCNSLGLTFADNEIVCKRPVTLTGVTHYEGVPYIMIDNTWKPVCISSHHAEYFCQSMSHSGYSGYNITVFQGESFTALYEVGESVEYMEYVLHKVEKSCDTYLRCQGKCTKPYISNSRVCFNTVSNDMEKSWWLEGETCSINCNYGYVRFGSESITCKADGSWSENPICAEQSPETKEVREGGTLTFSCSDGQFVKILSANYHAVCSTWQALIPNYNIAYAKWVENCGDACEFNDVRYKVIDYCSSRKVCSIPATNDMFGDPCPQITKMLKVVAMCDNT